MKVALLGTGKMGTAIARRLADAGFGLTLWNRTLEKAHAVGAGTVAATPAEAAAGADVVLSILYGPESVREVSTSLRPAAGQVFVEMSTSGPDVVEELAPRVEAAGASLLAAPILGSLPAIAQGTALILVGGDTAAFERVEPVLAAFGQPTPAGSRRDAAGLKLVSNAMLGVVNAAAAELLAAGRREGLDPEAVFKLLCRTVPYLEVRRRGFLERVHEPPLFQLEGLVKDLDLALEAGHESGAVMPIVMQIRELYAAAVPEHGREEMTALIERYPT
jgi:3-hydroxyisobutyrate dehydrogenase-like beta-hydroxyacid dehydrogenase